MKRDSAHILSEWLVINSQLGDTDAMQQLLQIWYPKMLRYSARQLGHQQQAEDAVQNALEAISSKIKSLNDPAAFPKWCYQILHLKGVDVIRSKVKAQKLDSQLQQSHLACESNDEEPAELIHFERSLAQLTPQTYQLIHLHYLEGLSHQAISEILNLPLGTVKSRLFNARKVFQSTLEGDDDGRSK